MTDTTIAIEGMHCEGWAQRVKRALEQERGVREAKVSYADREARVTFGRAGDDLGSVARRRGARWLCRPPKSKGRVTVDGPLGACRRPTRARPARFRRAVYRRFEPALREISGR